MRRLSLDMQEIMQALALIDHPHIVHIADIFSYHQELYVIEEYLKGIPFLRFWKIMVF